MSRPPHRISPAVGCSNPRTRSSSVLLPAPLDPTKATVVCSATFTETPEHDGFYKVESVQVGKSSAALVGGGSIPHPGEISLAHQGVLFLDEICECDRRTLEALREPLDSGRIHISRAARQAEFPAHFQLVAAMNPCPCGYLGDASGRCRCTVEQVLRYRNRISGPLLDRIDLQIEVPAVPAETLQSAPDGEPSSVVRARVAHAHARQIERQNKENGRLSVKEIDRYCQPEAAAGALLKHAIGRFQLSARAYHRLLKVARTVADLAGNAQIGAAHVAEAVQYRRFTRE